MNNMGAVKCVGLNPHYPSGKMFSRSQHSRKQPADFCWGYRNQRVIHGPLTHPVDITPPTACSSTVHCGRFYYPESDTGRTGPNFEAFRVSVGTRSLRNSGIAGVATPQLVAGSEIHNLATHCTLCGSVTSASNVLLINSYVTYEPVCRFSSGYKQNNMSAMIMFGFFDVLHLFNLNTGLQPYTRPTYCTTGWRSN